PDIRQARRASYHRGVSLARQALSPSRGLVLIGLAAVLWGTTGSIMTVLSARAAASPLLVGAARLWIAAVLLLVTMLLTGDGPFVDGATPCPRHAHRPHGTRYNDIWRCV